MRISIVIPTYEYNGLAKSLLNTLLKSIEKQTYKNYEIIVSDHSKNDVIKEYLMDWQHLPIFYYKNELGIGNSSVNMNHGIKLSKVEYIKIMHMDDWFCNDNTLFLIDQSINEEKEKSWGGVGFNHFYEERNSIERFISPHINENLKTLLGCPSVSFFKNDENFFDEDLIIINDSDMHIRLGKKYGDPILINEYCVTVRMSENQVSNTIGYSKHIEEINYYNKKHFS